MSRPKRRCRGGRVTPKGTRPARRRGELPCGCPTAEELLLRSASTAAASDANLDEAAVSHRVVGFEVAAGVHH